MKNLNTDKKQEKYGEDCAWSTINNNDSTHWCNVWSELSLLWSESELRSTIKDNQSQNSLQSIVIESESVLKSPNK